MPLPIHTNENMVDVGDLHIIWDPAVVCVLYERGMKLFVG